MQKTVLSARQSFVRQFIFAILIGFVVLPTVALSVRSNPQAVLRLPLFIAQTSSNKLNPPPGNPVQQGIATYYNATGAGACLFDPSPDDLMVAALNADEFDTAALCGAFVRVDGPDGTITVRIVDLCPECSAGHLDLSREAFALIAEPILGRVPISWQLISPEIEGPIAYHFKDGSNQWWTAVQIYNHRNPIAKVEYKADNNWIEVPRTAYNFFVQADPGMGVGPYEFRVTDIYGHVLTDSNIPHRENGTIDGYAQFPIEP